MNVGTCEVCGGSLHGKRADARWCSRACRQRAKRAEGHAGPFRRVFGGGRDSNSSPVAVHASDSRASDERFARMLAADAAGRVPDDRAAEWLRYEKRHGTPHPDRVADQIRRAAAGQVQRAPRFTVPTVAERGRAERKRAPMPVYSRPGSPWTDDSDPDLMELPQTINGRPYRSWR